MVMFGVNAERKGIQDEMDASYGGLKGDFQGKNFADIQEEVIDFADKITRLIETNNPYNK